MVNRPRGLRTVPFAGPARRASVVDGAVEITHHIEGVLLDGTPNTVDVVDVYTVRDGQVVRMEAYCR